MAIFSYIAAFAALASAVYSNGDIKMPPECEGKDFCTIQSDYHATQVAAMDSAVLTSKYWAGIAALSEPYTGPEVFYSKPDANCAYVTKVEKPFIIKVEHVNKLVVQSTKFTQTINTTLCTDKDMSCFEEIVAMQGNIQASCDEKYAEITLYVFEGEKINGQPFRIPISCSCVVKFNQY